MELRGDLHRHGWIAAAIVVALGLGFGLGWALFAAVAACGLMLAAVFWLGWASARSTPSGGSVATEDDNGASQLAREAGDGRRLEV